jgi:hypothetical protein
MRGVRAVMSYMLAPLALPGRMPTILVAER